MGRKQANQAGGGVCFRMEEQQLERMAKARDYPESHLGESGFCCDVNGKPAEDCEQVRDGGLGAGSGLPCSGFAL